MSAALQAAQAYVARGWNPLPLPFKSKIPTDKGWQKRVIGEADLPKYFNGKPQNVGVVLGPSSNGLTDVDLDCPGSRCELAPHVLPKTGAIFGRRSAPASHWLYRTSSRTPGKATIQFLDPIRPKDNVMLLEVRIGGVKGAQTVFPGSVHESDEEIRWDDAGDPAKVPDDDLLKQARLLASASPACTLLARRRRAPRDSFDPRWLLGPRRTGPAADQMHGRRRRASRRRRGVEGPRQGSRGCGAGISCRRYSSRLSAAQQGLRRTCRQADRGVAAISRLDQRRRRRGR